MAGFAGMWNGMRDGGSATPYLLIDSAGLPGGRAQIPEQAFSRLECLFTGDLAIELADVGPYLGRLRSLEKPVTDAVEELLLAQVACVAILREPAATEGSFADLHRQFRKLNVVYGPDGQPLFFRYYDPRVILDVLTVLDAAQLEAFFGTLEALVFADAEGEMVRCGRREGQLIVTRSGGAAR
jgi:hypothetical protein